ncbi:MAG: metal ABC transporter permease [Acidimicrobiales bacterium]
MEFLTDPYGWWIEPFTQSPIMVRGLLAGLLVVVSTSVIGTWMVLRGLSFLGDALAHGVLPGVAIAAVLGANRTVGALIAAAVMVGGINVLRSRSPLPDDTSIGVLFVGFLALAVVIMSGASGSYAGDLQGFLFGQIAAVGPGDLRRQAVAAVAILAGVMIGYRAFLVLSFDEVQAELLGLRPRLAHLAMLILLAFAIVASFQVVGNLLVFAFLIAPPATACLLVRRVPVIMVTAVVIGSVAVLVGLLISWHHGTAAGATIALGTVVIYIVTVLVRSVFGGAVAGHRAA